MKEWKKPFVKWVILKENADIIATSTNRTDTGRGESVSKGDDILWE